MARNEQLVRQHAILQLLEASRFGLRLEELRDELVSRMGLGKLSDRTVRRDLEALQIAGCDVDVHDSERGSIWKLGPRMRSVPAVQATATELLALEMGRELLASLRGTPFWQGIESLRAKMRQSLPEAVWKHVEEQRGIVHMVGTPSKSYDEQHGIIATVNRAILQNRVLDILYQSRDESEPSPRELEPHIVAVYRGSLYLVALPHPSTPEMPFKHYKLDRFRKATALDRWFKPREDFDPEEHFADSLGMYKAGTPEKFHIRLDDELVPWVAETPWHPRQEIFRRPANRSRLVIPDVFEDEIIPRVLSLGEKAEILRPVHSRERLVAQLGRMQARYALEDPPHADKDDPEDSADAPAG